MTRAGVAWLMVFEAATLVVASALHVTGGGDGSLPFDPDRAAVAEAVIASVLLVGAAVLRRGAAAVALGATLFAVAGFCVGLTMTVRGGRPGDVAYHATMLPLLLLTAVLLGRRNVRRA